MAGMRIWQFFIPFPQEIVDHGLELTLGEYRLLGYLLRHQLRLGKSSIRLSQDELLNGRKLPDGSRVDRGCRLTCARDLLEARRRLAARGWIRYAETPEGWVYELVNREQPALSTPSTESTAQVQNAPADQVQNALDSGANCTQFQVQNAPAIKGSRRSEEGLSLSGSKTPDARRKTPSTSAQQNPQPTATDPRHVPVRELFKQGYASNNHLDDVAKVPWDGGDAKALNEFLAAHPRWTVEGEITRCLAGWFRSDVNIARRGRKVFKSLDEFVRPVNRFDTPQEFTTTKQAGVR